MTREEAEKFVALLKSGKDFRTRFQEETWGLRCRNGAFEHWGERLTYEIAPSGETIDRTETFNETLTEAQVIEMMIKYYNYEVMTGKMA